MVAAAPGRENIERYMIMIGNSKFWHILKQEPFIFPKARWTAGIIAWGPDVLHSSVFDEKEGEDERERTLKIDK
eukprot:12288396-Karenia_brevis.AAC.1